MKLYLSLSKYTTKTLPTVLSIPVEPILHAGTVTASVSSQSLLQGEESEFKVTLSDNNGTPLKSDFTVTIQDENNNKSPVNSIVDHGDGSYTVKYIPKSPRLSVRLEKKDIVLADFQVESPPADAKMCKAFGPGLESPVQGEDTYFVVDAKDKDGNLAKDRESDIHVEIQLENTEKRNFTKKVSLY